MALRPVRIYGDPVLRQKAVAVEAFDETLRQLAADMHETMAAYKGVGLAANQIGVLQRILVVDVPVEDEDRRERYTLVNPEVSKRSGSQCDEEGCLSIPGIYEDVTIAHEIDHLDGVLFVDRLSPLKRQFLRGALGAIARGELPEGYRPPTAEGERR